LASSALTVKVNEVPAVAVVGAVTTRWVAVDAVSAAVVVVSPGAVVVVEPGVVVVVV
jgi:hypothetical protein